MMKWERKKMASGERNVKTWYKGDFGINLFSLSSCTGLAPLLHATELRLIC